MKLEIAIITVFQSVISLSTIVNFSIVIDLFNSSNSSIIIVFTINIDQKYITSIDIIVYDIKFFVVVLTEMIEFYFNFRTKYDFIVNLLSNEWMFINLQSNVIVQSFKIYSINQANKNFIDKKFDKLQIQNKLKFIIQFTSYSYSMFVIWQTIYHSKRFLNAKSAW